MLNSKERMDFIIDYMSAYKEKIQMANKNGLFDTAKLFELFAIEVCSLLYGQKFLNLNDITANYPYFDLLSEDKQLFVQVSTINYVPTKIKTTLENIRDSKDDKYSQVNKVIFFVLSNDSIDKVKEYSGDNQIGNISFTINDNLITTNDVIQKAKDNMDFQTELYSRLKKEFDSFDGSSKRFNNALELSKKVGLNNISTLINEEYEINRNAFIEKIKNDDCRFISIQGREGSGKSVICKKLIENDKLILYARAERFVEESHLDNIWNFNIREVLEYLNEKKIFFFIDALEFIADAPKTKIELLESLYSISNQYKNVYIITSCRTSDKNAFIKLESNFMIKTYEVNDITEEELNLLRTKYPIISKMYNDRAYASLLKSPFYINTIISKSINIGDINDTNSFRNYIWEHIICLKEKSKSYNIDHSQIREVINKIVFERAKKFLVGIHKDEIEHKIVQVLSSEGVIVQQGEYIRLKYDIYEDICFEHYFDKVFNSCKGKYQSFYEQIEKLGRCVYRRYQIWISNKLFIQENRDKFLYNIIFSDKIAKEWKRQTEIGIVKSSFCANFFEEQEENIIEQNLLNEFITVVNLFAFDAKLLNNGTDILHMKLIPIGIGRQCIIHIIKSRELYLQNTIKRDDVVKLCLDYSNQRELEQQTSLEACNMMEYYIENSLKESENYYKIIDKIDLCLTVLYKLTDASIEWLKSFFVTLTNDYINGDTKKVNVAEDIMEWTLKNAYPPIVEHLSNELCSIADLLWIKGKSKTSESPFHHIRNSFEESDYGLSEESEHYDYDYNNIKENAFLWNLFRLNFKTGFEWAIQFINKAIEEYANHCPEYVTKIKIKIDNSSSDFKEYWGNPRMWVTGIMEHQLPTLIGDIIFIMKDVLLGILEDYKHDKEFISKFANYYKTNIYLKSNNIIPLTIIESIGIRFQKELPGFALELATSIDIIHWDTSRYTLYLKNPLKDMLEKQILTTVGLPELKYRYKLDPKCNIHIQEYVSNAQIYFDMTIQEKCYKVLDYLYSIIKNDEENARDYLQIQKMDMRNAKIERINDNVVALHPEITGEAKKIVKEHEKSKIPDKKLYDILVKYETNTKEGTFDLKLLIEVINILQDFVQEEDLRIQYENILIQSIAAALLREELPNEERDEFCSIWLDGIEKLFFNGSFVSDITLIPILIKQLENNISDYIKNRIKKIILECLMYDEQNGVIQNITTHIQKYLYNNKSLAKAVFNTIIKLAEDEMQHQKYNAKYIKLKKIEKNLKFIPNMQSKLSGVDRYIEDNAYISNKEEIIKVYLFSEKPLEIKNFNMSNYDIETMCYIPNCGLNFDDDDFKNIISKILKCMIDIWDYNRNTHENHITDVYQQHEIIKMFEREIVQSNSDAENIINLLFDNIDFSKFTLETIRFYQDIFGPFICEFFDSYIDVKRRNRCKRKILYIEKKVNEINIENIKIQLYKSLMLSVTNYCHWDFRKCETDYSYSDKQFLNEQFTKFGKYHIKELLRTIYQLNMDHLLPEILVSVRNSFQAAILQQDKFIEELKGDGEIIIDWIIIKSFTKYNDEIKEDQELINAYEDILNMLIDLNYEKAAVILDKFRVN